MHPSRRHALAAFAAGLAHAAAPPAFAIATFSCEVTTPLGHPLMGGGVAPAKTIEDPLFTHGFVLLSSAEPIVVACVDWCEIRNDAFTRWREMLAKAAGTSPSRVLVSSIHQHDTPIADLEAERILKQAKATGSVCDAEFHETTIQAVAKSVRAAIKSPRRITHFGTAQAKVEKVASNRRYVNKDDKIVFGRTSATRDAFARQAPEGNIDPFLKTLSFWDNDAPVAALSVYATHPMSYYGRGGVTSDFVGLARKLRQAEQKGTLILYGSGASGNVTAGKYNDGDPANRPALAQRILDAMRAAWKDTKLRLITQLDFRSVPYRLEPRQSAGFTVEDLTKRLKEDKRPFGQCLAALGLSWRKRADAGHKLDLPILDLGGAQLLLLPGEVYVEYQLAAQKMKPDSFVMTLGYGECATGYVPIERAWEERDGNLSDWCWVAPGAEKTLMGAIKSALR